MRRGYFRRPDLNWQTEMKARAASVVCCRPEAATVGFNDGLADRQTHAAAMRLGCKEGVENLVNVLVWQAYASVTD